MICWYYFIDVILDIPVIKTALKRLRILSVSMIVFGVLSIIIGIIIVSIIGSHGEFPTTSGSQIWAGAVVCH